MSKANRIKEDYELPLIWWMDLTPKQQEESVKGSSCENHLKITMEEIIEVYKLSKN